jgi:DNA-binding phage protein
MATRYIPVTAAELAIWQALRDAIVRTGWSETARRVGMDRTALHRAFGATKPSTRSCHFATIMAVADAVGLELRIAPRGGA